MGTGSKTILFALNSQQIFSSEKRCSLCALLYIINLFDLRIRYTSQLHLTVIQFFLLNSSTHWFMVLALVCRRQEEPVAFRHFYHRRHKVRTTVKLPHGFAGGFLTVLPGNELKDFGLLLTEFESTYRRPISHVLINLISHDQAG